MSTEPPAAQPATISGADALQPHRTDISFLSPSARTSFTRVDVGSGNEQDDGANAQDGLQVEQQADGDDGADQEPGVPQTPQVSLTFLLVSGRRRTMSFDPENTVGRAKELVWNAWPNGACYYSCCCLLSLPNRHWPLGSLPLISYPACNICWTYLGTEWQDERPPAPSYLRILYLGKVLQDDDTLTSCVLFVYPSFLPVG